MHPPRIAAFVLHQRTAPLDARERALQIVAPWQRCPDRFVLATCHRVEVYAAVGAAEPVGEWLERELDHGLDRSVASAFAWFEDVDAVRHLFEVACGLDSAVQGEPQIRSQVRVLLTGREALDPILRRALERALHLARALRRGTHLGRGTRSVGSLAVDELVRLLEAPARSRVLVVGAGEMGSLAVRALARRVAGVVVANRDRERGELLARATGAVAVGLHEIRTVLREVDAIVSAADTRGELLSPALLGARVSSRPLVLVDVAVPRSVGAEARALPNLIYRSVDELPGAQILSAQELVTVRETCVREAERFVREESARAAAEAIRDVRAHADAVRRQQVDRAMRQLGHLSQRDRRLIEALTTRVVNALLHEPTVALKEQPARGAYARAFFGIGRDER